MAKELAPCRVCGQEVSEYAEKCPKCGDPTARRYGRAPRKPTNPWMVIGWIIVIALVLPIATCVSIIGGGAVKDYEARTQPPG